VDRIVRVRRRWRTQIGYVRATGPVTDERPRQ